MASIPTAAAVVEAASQTHFAAQVERIVSAIEIAMKNGFQEVRFHSVDPEFKGILEAKGYTDIHKIFLIDGSFRVGGFTIPHKIQDCTLTAACT